MRIRQLDSPSDLRGAHRVNVLAWREAYRGLVPEDVLGARSLDVPEEVAEERFEEVTGDTGAFVVALNDANEVRGYARVRWGEDTKSFVDPNGAGLKEIYVHPDDWDEGIGTDLLDRVLDALPDDVDTLTLEMLAGNELAQSFYTARGFDHVGSRRAEFGGETLETAIYEKKL